MPDGWIKIHRKFQEWGWYDKSEMVHIFLHLLLNASVSDKVWHGKEIKRGQVITGRKRISAETGISERTIRTCLQRLIETGEIEIESTNKYSIVTICNYECYQCGISESDQQESTERPSVKTPKKTKEEIKADTERRMKEFYTSLIPFVQTYGKQMVREFYDYWSETNKSGSKMRWEQQTTWVLERRLEYWSRNDKSYKSKSNGIDRTNNSTREERATGAANLVARLIADNKPVDE